MKSRILSLNLTWGKKIKTIIVMLAFISIDIFAEISRFDYDRQFSNFDVQKFEASYVLDGYLSSDDVRDATVLTGSLGEFYKAISECKSIDESFIFKVNDFSLKGLRMATITLSSFFGDSNNSNSMDFLIERIAGQMGYSAHDDNILNYELGLLFFRKNDFNTSSWYFSKVNGEHRAKALHLLYSTYKDKEKIIANYYLKKAEELGSIDAKLDLIDMKGEAFQQRR